MELTIPQITDIILNRPNATLIQAAQKNSKKLRMHMYGDGLSSEISMIEGHEKDQLLQVRKKYAKSNKDLFSRLARPIDKVFSARGGSVYYNLTDRINNQAAALASNIKDGLSIRKWVETKWKPHFLDDPNGMIFMEIGNQVNGRINSYPTYKSINVVYDYLPSGNKLEYIVFTVSANEKIKSGYKKEDEIYRVVDDVNDYWVKRNDQSVSVINSCTFPNYFGYVPAILNSDFADPEQEGIMLSLFSDVIELADDFLQTGSIRNLAKLRMAYPKYWELADECPTCNGTKWADGKDCVTCNGSGKKLMLNPGDAKLLPYPTDKDVPTPAPNVAGFVEFPQGYFDFSTTELESLENLSTITIWGTESQRQTNGMSTDSTAKTATEIINDIQPKADRLLPISEMAEKRHKFILDNAIVIAIDSSYRGSSVNYGRRYMIEGPDVIWERYSNARQKGAAISILDDLLMEYIETKYNGDPVSMNIQLKLFTVEPFIHFTVSQVQSLNVSFEDYNKKLYFSEWLATVTEAMLLSFSAEELKAQLADYVTAKSLKEPVKIPTAA